MAARTFVAVRGIVFAIAFVSLWAWLASIVRRYDAVLPPLPARLWPLGALLVVCGSAVAASCVAVFIGRGRGTPAPFDPPREFVASGPYRYVRNPMYIGAIAVLAGTALILRSPSIALLGVAFWASAHALVVLYEEPALEARFGAPYTAYRSSVSRWWPRIR